jgi:hypothetical protein
VKKGIEDFVGGSEGQKPIGRPRRKWEDNVEIYLKLTIWDGVDLIGRVQDREKKRSVVEAVTNIWFHEVSKILYLYKEHLDSLKYSAMIIVPLKVWNVSNSGEQTYKNENSIHEEIKNRSKSGNACYHSVQNLLSSSMLSKHLKFRIYRTIILSVVFYGCETWSFTMREERGLRVFENRVLRRILGPKRDEVTGEWRETT